MNGIIKVREYFVAWLLFAFGSIGGGAFLGGLVGGVIGGTAAALGRDLITVLPLIKLGGFIVGTMVSCVMFIWIVSKLIVKKVETRVKQVMQNTEQQETNT